MNTFLVLGDIHFGSFADHRDFITQAGAKNAVLSNPQPMLEGLIDQARATGFSFDGILAPGDLTSTAAPSEFVECEKAVKTIADRLGVPHEAIYLTFGNHDVNWSISRLADGRDHVGSDPLYRQIAAKVGATLLTQNKPTLAGPLPGSGLWITGNFEVLVLNSGFDCNHDQKIRNGNLGDLQLKWLAQLPLKGDKKWRLLMIHHHPMNLPYPVAMTDISTLAEGAEILDEIDRLGVDFVLHGHRHHPILHTEFRQGWARPVTLLCAGSVGVGAAYRQGGDIPNVFHIVKFTGRAARDAAEGIVHTYSFRAGTGWAPTEYSKETPIDAVQCFGACATPDEAKAELTRLLGSNLAAGLDTFRLPPFDSLPVALRSFPASKINRLTREVLEGGSYTMVGTFPKAVIAIK